MMKNSSERCQYPQEIVKFISDNPEQKLDHQNVYDIFNLYEKWKSNEEESKSPEFEQYVIYYIAERAFWSNFTDSECIEKLLVYMFKSFDHFRFFLCPFESKFSLSDDLKDARYDLARYFLNHAYKQKLTINGRRIVDVEVNYLGKKFHPCEMAVEESPELLQFLFQYGAFMTNETVFDCWFSSCPGTWGVVRLMVCVMDTVLQILNLEPSQTQELTKMISCGTIILRVCPQIRKDHLNGIHFPGFLFWRPAVIWLADNYLPQLKYRILYPMPLKHACRLRIRKFLNDKWELPNGITKLNVPYPLEKFLNLDCD